MHPLIFQPEALAIKEHPISAFREIRGVTVNVKNVAVDNTLCFAATTPRCLGGVAGRP